VWLNNLHNAKMLRIYSFFTTLILSRKRKNALSASEKANERKLIFNK
jgi:hypothetical protein